MEVVAVIEILFANDNDEMDLSKEVFVARQGKASHNTHAEPFHTISSFSASILHTVCPSDGGSGYSILYRSVYPVPLYPSLCSAEKFSESRKISYKNRSDRQKDRDQRSNLLKKGKNETPVSPIRCTLRSMQNSSLACF